MDPLHYVVAVIRPFQLDAVLDALRQLPTFPGMTVTDVQGFGARSTQTPHGGDPRGINPFTPSMRLEIFCGPQEVSTIVETIQTAAHTGSPGDGKIFAGPATFACRIRTGERGDAALLPARSGKD